MGLSLRARVTCISRHDHGSCNFYTFIGRQQHMVHQNRMTYIPRSNASSPHAEGTATWVCWLWPEGLAGRRDGRQNISEAICQDMDRRRDEGQGGQGRGEAARGREKPIYCTCPLHRWSRLHAHLALWVHRWCGHVESPGWAWCRDSRGRGRSGEARQARQWPQPPSCASFAVFKLSKLEYFSLQLAHWKYSCFPLVDMLRPRRYGICSRTDSHRRFSIRETILCKEVSLTHI